MPFKDDLLSCPTQTTIDTDSTAFRWLSTSQHYWIERNPVYVVQFEEVYCVDKYMSFFKAMQCVCMLKRVGL